MMPTLSTQHIKFFPHQRLLPANKNSETSHILSMAAALPARILPFSLEYVAFAVRYSLRVRVCSFSNGKALPFPSQTLIQARHESKSEENVSRLLHARHMTAFYQIVLGTMKMTPVDMIMISHKKGKKKI